MAWKYGRKNEGQMHHVQNQLLRTSSMFIVLKAWPMYPLGILAMVGAMAGFLGWSPSMLAFMPACQRMVIVTSDILRKRF